MVRRMTDETNTEDVAPQGERIAKALARAGIASRREVERMIEDGRIKIDGKRLETPATLITGLDGITVDGKPVAQADETRLWRFHKRKGTLTTYSDPEGRPTVFENLPNHIGRVIAVGRLDMNTEGLLLFTNDGELARWLELPSNGFVRRYRARCYGSIKQADLDKLRDGITIDGIHYGEIDARLESEQATNVWLNIAIKEGKNREVRRIMEHLGLEVNRLIRIAYGPFTLGTMKREMTAPVSRHQMIELLPEFLQKRQGSVAAPKQKVADPSKWAKAKPKPSKPGESRRRKSSGKPDPTRRPARRGISGGQGDYAPKKKRPT